jgi:hypothetical protein
MVRIVNKLQHVQNLIYENDRQEPEIMNMAMHMKKNGEKEIQKPQGWLMKAGH